MEALNRWIMSQDYPQDDASYEHEAMKCPAMKDWLHAWGERLRWSMAWEQACQGCSHGPNAEISSARRNGRLRGHPFYPKSYR